MKFEIELNRGIEVVKKFCNYALNLDTDVYLQQGRFTVDAKSIMGVFSLNLLDVIELQIDEVTDKAEEFIKIISDMGIVRWEV